MSRKLPIKKDLIGYRGSTHSLKYAFVDEDDSDIDLDSNYPGLQFRIFKPGREDDPEVDHTKGDGISILNTNELVTEVSKETTKELFGQVLWYELRYTLADDSEDAWFRGRYILNNAGSGGEEASSFDVTYNATTDEVQISSSSNDAASAANSLAQTQQLKSDVEGLKSDTQTLKNSIDQSETNVSQDASQVSSDKDTVSQLKSDTQTLKDTTQTLRDETETFRDETADELQAKRVEDDAFAFNQHVIATTSIDELPPATSILPTRPDLEHPALNFIRNSGGSAFDRLGNKKDYAADEIRYNFNRDTGIFTGRYLEGQATRLNTQFSSPSSNEDVAVSNVEHTISFWGDGSIELSGAHSETINGTDSVTRTEVQFTPSAGTLTISPSGDVEFLQLEEGGFATSPIAGDGQQKTRDPDIATVTGLDAINFNPQEGTVVVEATSSGRTTSTGSEYILVGSDSSTNFGILRGNSTRGIGAYINGDFVDYDDWPANSEIKYALSYNKSEDQSFHTANGGNVDTINRAPLSDIPSLNIGQNNNSGHLNGFIRSLEYYPRRLSNTKLQALTS